MFRYPVTYEGYVEFVSDQFGGGFSSREGEKIGILNILITASLDVGDMVSTFEKRNKCYILTDNFLDLETNPDIDRESPEYENTVEYLNIVVESIYMYVYLFSNTGKNNKYSNSHYVTTYKRLDQFGLIVF